MVLKEHDGMKEVIRNLKVFNSDDEHANKLTNEIKNLKTNKSLQKRTISKLKKIKKKMEKLTFTLVVLTVLLKMFQTL